MAARGGLAIEAAIAAVLAASLLFSLDAHKRSEAAMEAIEINAAAIGELSGRCYGHDGATDVADMVDALNNP